MKLYLPEWLETHPRRLTVEQQIRAAIYGAKFAHLSPNTTGGVGLHATTHNAAGTDALAGDAAAATASLRTLGLGAAQAMPGNTSLPAGITIAAEQATTSGTSIDFTGIPAGVKRIIAMLNGVSTAGADNPRVQIGPVGGVETSGYAGVSQELGVASGTAIASGFDLASSSPAATATYYGTFTLTLEDASDNTWIATWCVTDAVNTQRLQVGTGRKAIAGALSRLRLTTVSGIGTFDAGVMSIAYE